MDTVCIESSPKEKEGEGGARGEEKDRLDECKHIQATTTANLLQANQAQAGQRYSF